MVAMNVMRAVQAIVPAELCKSGEDTTDITVGLRSTVKQQVVLSMVHMFNKRLIDNGETSGEAMNRSLALATEMMENRDCTLDTFQKLQRELAATQHIHLNTQQLYDLTAQIIEGLADIKNPSASFSVTESQNLTEYVEAVEKCRLKADNIVAMLRGHIEPITTDLLQKYATLMSQLQ